MEIALKPEHEQVVEKWVADGRFGSAEEAVAAALELLHLQDSECRDDEPLTPEVREMLQVGVEQLARGEFLEYRVGEGERFVEDVRRRAEARFTGKRGAPAR